MTITLVTASNYTYKYDSCSKEAAGTLFLPLMDESGWNEGLRVFLYLIGLLWCFMGVAIIADVFMCAIETITSKTKTIQVPRQDSSEIEEVEIRVWNDTVANLTLMALGSSAPEILLSIIEIVITNKFKAGELGPSTIVGSAAFNLLVITGVCVMAIPGNGTRRVKAIKVFAITATFCILAYIWLYVALSAVTPNVIDLWEAILTFLLFPILIVIAYIADKEYGCGGKNVSPQDGGGLELAEGSKKLTPSAMSGPHESESLNNKPERNINYSESGNKFTPTNLNDPELEAFIKYSPPHLKDPELEAYIKEVSRNPELSEEDAAKLVAMKIKAKQPKDYGYYRVGALRNFSGGNKLRPKMDGKLKVMYDELSDVGFSSSGATHLLSSSSSQPARIEFAAPKCSVLESDKLVKIGVVRTGNTKVAASVNYETVDGTATSGSDYVEKKDVLVFKPGETLKYIDITIIDDNEWEENEVFFVKLSRYDPKDETVQIGKLQVTEVTIINDDEPGVLSFQNPSYLTKESIGAVKLIVERTNGSDGKVSVKWTTKDQSAINGRDFHGGTGVLTFEHGEQLKYIEIDIVDDKEFEKDESFLVELSDPTGGSSLGKIKRTIVTIVNDDEYRRLFDRVVSLTHLNLHRLELGSQSWGQQFKDAMSVNGGDLENATTIDYVMHFLTFAWKIIFAFCPPCSWLGGWLTFFTALCFIGLLTAVVGDLATIFGCLVGLKKEVTAITFVALGTSLPDLFASKAAATGEKYADASIGNVTGSNSVNVFLGLGTPWVIAAIYWEIKGKKFEVDAGTLSISVVSYTICAIICVSILVLRRFVKGLGRAELGGPAVPKYATGVIFITLWIIYIIVNSLVTYGRITF